MIPPDQKVLVVDDMKSMRMAVKSKLKKLGIKNISEADDGSTGWESILNELHSGKPFDLILSDWNMPTMPGIDLLEKVKTHPQLKTTPFILITAEADKEQVLEAIKKGVDTYLTKPFTQDDFNAKIKEVQKKIAKAS